MTDEHIKAWPLTQETEAEIMDDFDETGILSRTQSYLLLGAHAHWRQAAEAKATRVEVAGRRIWNLDANISELSNDLAEARGQLAAKEVARQAIADELALCRADLTKAREQVSASAAKCTTCHGSGVRRESRGFQSVVLDCSACDGSGVCDDSEDALEPGTVADDGSRFRCECCEGTFDGDGYYSVQRSNDAGIGVVVCEKCCAFVDLLLTRTTQPGDQHPTQPTLVDTLGVRRFKDNEIVRRLLYDGPLDMDQIAARGYSDEDQRQFAQLLGYSVSGYQDLSYATAIDVEDTVDASDKPSTSRPSKTTINSKGESGSWLEVMDSGNKRVFVTVARGDDGEDDERVALVDRKELLAALGPATSPAIPQASRDRLICFFYLLTRGIPKVRGMAWGDVKPIVRTAASTTENTYTSDAGLALANELVDELLGKVSQ